MNFAFAYCQSLIHFPDISIWRTDKVKYLASFAQNDVLLSHLPERLKLKIIKEKKDSNISN